MRWLVNATPRLLYPQESPGTHCIGAWVGPRTGEENLAHTGIRSPDRPARSESLYRLSYRGPRCLTFSKRYSAFIIHGSNRARRILLWFLEPLKWKQYACSKRRWKLTSRHNVTYRRILTAVRASNVAFTHCVRVWPSAMLTFFAPPSDYITELVFEVQMTVHRDKFL